MFAIGDRVRVIGTASDLAEIYGRIAWVVQVHPVYRIEVEDGVDYEVTSAEIEFA